MRREARKLPAVALAALCLVVAGAHSASAGSAVTAVAAEPTVKKSVLGPATVNGRDLLPAYRDLGAGLWQTQLRWDAVALARPADPTDPSDPAYRWPPELGRAIDEAAGLGMQISMMISGTPRWANGGMSARWVPTDPADYATFVAAASRKYPNVHLWMVWGEPSRDANFAPFTTPARSTGPLSEAEQVAPHNYARLLDAAYGALKAVNPANLVIGGNTYLSQGGNVIHPYQWLNYLTLPDGSRPRLDMWGHNAYGYRKPTLKGRQSPDGRVDFVDLPRLARALDRVFPNAPPLFISEWGVQGAKKHSPSELGHVLTFKQQARWIRAAYRSARSWDRIYTVGWPHAVATQISPKGGLLDVNGNPTPTYYAFKAA